MGYVNYESILLIDANLAFNVYSYALIGWSTCKFTCVGSYSYSCKKKEKNRNHRKQ